MTKSNKIRIDSTYNYQKMNFKYHYPDMFYVEKKKEPFYKKLWVVKHPIISLTIVLIFTYLVACDFNPDWILILEILAAIAEGANNGVNQGMLY